jgi:flagellar hook-associated protein 2
MSGLKLPGVGSGFDIQSMVDATVSATRAPKEQQLARRASQIDVRLSAYGNLKSVLDEFKTSLKKLNDESAFQKRSTTLSSSGFVTASADKSAVAGSYKLVVEELAQAHKIGSSRLTGDNAAKTKLGSGSIELSLANGDSFNVSISQGKSTLADIAEAINNAEDNKGVKATVVNDDLGSRLVLFSEKTGTDNAISVNITGNGDGDDGGNLEDLLGVDGFAELQPAENARLTLDGATVTSQSNEIKNAIAGVTLNLSKVSDWEDSSNHDLGKKSLTLSIGYDKSSVENNLKGFVESFNKVINTINRLTSYNADTQNAGALNGDASARSITTQIRGLLGEQVEGALAPIKSLTDLGITTTREGTLELDNDLLKKQLDENFEKVGALFSSEKGVAAKLDGFLESYVGKEGVLTNRDKSLRDQMKKLEKEADDFTDYMAQYEERIYKQFSAMDMMIAKMNQQLSAVVSAFENMPNFNNNKK